MKKKLSIDALNLKYNERISRMLLVLGTFSLIGLSFKKLLYILGRVFNAIYVHSIAFLNFTILQVIQKKSKRLNTKLLLMNDIKNY